MPDSPLLADRYRLNALLDRGPLGRMWRAYDVLLNREVTVQEVVAHPWPGASREAGQHAHVRRARTVARLDHPGILPMHDVVEEDERLWLVTAPIPARSLGDLGRLDFRNATEIGMQILAALQHAHARGVLHGALQPDRVLISEAGLAVVAGWGMVAHDSSLTGMGTPLYVSPEVIRGEEPGPSSDLWGLGATLYAAIEGHPPHQRNDMAAMLAARLSQHAAPPREAGPLAPVLVRLLDPDPDRRPSAEETMSLLAEVAAAPGATPARLSRPLEPDDPARIGSYELVGRLGEGETGVVYQARSANGTDVVLRVLPVEQDEETFARQVDALRSVSCPSTPRVLDSGLSGLSPYVVSEFIDGPTVRQQVEEQGPLASTALERFAAATATALTAIHQAGMAHGDLTPGNIVMSPVGPYVVDFGIAHMAGRRLGTVAFSAPEQLSGSPPSKTSDMFAWGAVMLHAATGRPPFGDDVRRLPHDAPDLSPLAAHLQGIVADCLHEDPDARPTANEVLLRLLETTPPGYAQAAMPPTQAPFPYPQQAPAAPSPPAAPWAVPQLPQPVGPPVPGPATPTSPPTPFPHQPWHAPPQHAAAPPTEPGQPWRVPAAPRRAASHAGTLAGLAGVVLSVLLVALTVVRAVEATFDRQFIGIAALLTLGVAGLGVGGTYVGRRVLAERRAGAPARRNARVRKLLEQGRYGDAEAAAREVIASCSPGDPQASVAYGNLAVALRGLGRAAEAELRLEQARGLPQSPANWLRLQAHLDAVQHENGDGAAAQHLRGVLGEAERTLGRDASVVPPMRANLAVMLRDAGELEEAAQEAVTALETARRTLGPRSLVTLTARANLAAIRRDQGHVEDAERLFRETLRDMRRALGDDHPHTLTTQAGLAAVLHDLGRTEEAISLLTGVVDARSRGLGPDHVATLQARTNLGFVLLDGGRDDEAAAHFEAVVARGPGQEVKGRSLVERAAGGLAVARRGRDE